MVCRQRNGIVSGKSIATWVTVLVLAMTISGVTAITESIPFLVEIL